MRRTLKRTALAAASLAGVLGAMTLAPRMTANLSGQAPGFPTTKNGEWPYYTADVRGSRYSPLDQINATNFNQLEVAWRFKTDNLGTRPEFKLEGTPLMVKGVIYATGGTRRSVVALDAKTGELIWVYAEREGARAVNAPRLPRASCPGVAFRTGPTARATSASSTSRRAFASWSSMRRRAR